MIQHLPAVNALLNSIAAVFLFMGRRAIKSGKIRLHKKLMVAALITSTLFLTSYLTYHINVTAITRYEGEGILRGVYFFILVTHIPLAVSVVPLSLLAVWHALKQRFEKHTRITRWLWPIWMYVSITGVLIYVMLYIV